VAARRALTNGAFPRALPGWAQVLGLALLILLAYARVAHADFNWDDDAHITGNPTIIGPLGLKEIWTSGKANYFPLTMTSFWVEHAFWGLSPGPYHVVTLLFHAAGALVLWRVLLRLSVPGAWAGAALWALHPVQVESIAWICELKNTQSGLFYLWSVLFFVRWLQRHGQPGAGREYALSLAASILAVLSKSSTVMLPVVLLLIAWWQGRRKWRDAIWLAPFFAVSLVAGGWTIWEQKVNSMASGPDWSHGLAARFVIAGKVPWFYLGKLIWPEPLVFIYPRWDVTALTFIHWLPLVALLVAGGALWWGRSGRAQPVSVALVYFLISLFPVLGLFDVFFFKYSFVGDHLQYLASMGPLVLVAAAVVTVARRWAGTKLVPAGATVALLGGVALLTWRQTAIYRTRETLWRDTVTLNPRAWIARVNLGSELMSTGRPAEAIPHLQASLQIKPNDPMAETNWGVALIQLDRAAEAVPHLEAAARLMPTLAEAHDALGLALSATGQNDAALTQASEAVRLKPDDPNMRLNLGGRLAAVGRLPEALAQLERGTQGAPQHAGLWTAQGQVLVTMGRGDEAIARFQRAVQLDPRDFGAWSGLAEILTGKGAYPQALDCIAAALRLRPAWPEGHLLAGNALFLSGRAGEAIAAYEAALRLRPEFPEARGRLGVALYRAGRPAEAVAQFEAVVRAQPNSAEARNNLGTALLQTGRPAEALPQFLQALQLQPDHLPARSNLAHVLEAAGHRDQAIAQWEEILRRDPGQPGALEQLKRLRAGAVPPNN
jgi:protein O-mannosyl-transferase